MMCHCSKVSVHASIFCSFYSFAYFYWKDFEKKNTFTCFLFSNFLSVCCLCVPVHCHMRIELTHTIEIIIYCFISNSRKEKNLQQKQDNLTIKAYLNNPLWHLHIHFPYSSGFLFDILQKYKMKIQWIATKFDLLSFFRRNFSFNRMSAFTGGYLALHVVFIYFDAKDYTGKIENACVCAHFSLEWFHNYYFHLPKQSNYDKSIPFSRTDFFRTRKA